MSRILVGEEWYEPLSSRSILEAEYEQSIYRYSRSLFPGYVCVPFNETVNSDFGSSQADMVLIDNEYRGWTVVEAELEHHSLTRHVEPQMRRLVNGTYDERHARAIARRSEAIDESRLSNLVRNTDPDFLVIVPKENLEWRTTLSNLGVKLATIEVYVNKIGKRLVQYAGDLPQSWDDGHVTGLIRDGLLPRAFRVEIPSALPRTDTLTLFHHGFVTTWRIVAARRATYILPNGSLDLEEDQSYSLCRNGQGDLEIKADTND